MKYSLPAVAVTRLIAKPFQPAVRRLLLNAGVSAGLLAAAALSATAAHADQLADIKARHTLVCGVLGDSVPLGYQDPKTRQTIGFDVDICNAIATSIGVKAEIKSVAVAARIPALQTGRVDVVAAALGYNKTRAQQIDFSSSYYQTPLRLLVKNGSNLNTFADLKGKRVSAIRGSTPETYAREQLKDSTVLAFDDGPSAFLALQQDKTQAMGMSLFGAIGFRNRSGNTTHFMDQALYWEPECVGVKKGETSLLDAVNASLDHLETSGEMQTIWDKWFGPKTEFDIKREKKVTPLSAFE